MLDEIGAYFCPAHRRSGCGVVGIVDLLGNQIGIVVPDRFIERLKGRQHHKVVGEFDCAARLFVVHQFFVEFLARTNSDELYFDIFSHA